MSAASKIEWTGVTWNVVTGCDQISPGCRGCYALRMAKRLKAMGSPKYQLDGDPRTSGPGFGVAFHEDSLDEPLKWRTPRRVFVNSMSDLAHARITDDQIARIFGVMALAHRHQFQCLSKRPRRLARLLSDLDFQRRVAEHAASRTDEGHADWVYDAITGGEWWPLPNVWIGTSIESDEYCRRADALRRTPAALRFLSCEPLLGPLPGLTLTGIDWVIVGGESGPGAHPMHPQWARDLRDRCLAEEIPFFFKQWGEWAPRGVGIGQFRPPEQLLGPALDEMGHRQIMRRVGKRAAGRALDDVLWDEMPEVRR